MKTISQLGWLFPIYGKYKMFQTTKQQWYHQGTNPVGIQTSSWKLIVLTWTLTLMTWRGLGMGFIHQCWDIKNNCSLRVQGVHRWINAFPYDNFRNLGRHTKIPYWNLQVPCFIMMLSLKASHIKGKTLKTMGQTRTCIMITRKKKDNFLQTRRKIF